jgi:ABC-2 type transport system permease protein
MQAVLYIAGRSLLQRWRDRQGFFWWMIGFPLLIAVLIGFFFSGVVEGPSQPMTVVIIDQADNPQSQTYIKLMQETGGLRVRPMSKSEARAAVRKGNAAAFVVLEKDFDVTPTMLIGRSLPMSIGMDPSMQAETAYLQALLLEQAADFLLKQWTDPDSRERVIERWLTEMEQAGKLSAMGRQGMKAAINALADRFLSMVDTSDKQAVAKQAAAIKVTTVDADRFRPQSSFEICFPQGIIWGLIGVAAQFAVTLVSEREAGTMLRMRVAPIRGQHVLAGHGLACFVAAFGVMVFLLAIGSIFFGIRLQNIPALVLAMVAIGLCFTGMTGFLSVLGGSTAAVQGASWAFLLVMAMLGGGMVPQMFMPAWMGTVNTISPVKWAILGLEGGIWRGFSMMEMLKPAGILLLEGSLFAAAGLIIMNRRKTI